MYRGDVVVGKWVEKAGKVGGKVKLYTIFMNRKRFAQKFARILRRVLQVVLHWISTIWVILLSINFSFDFFNLIAESEVEFEIFLDFLNTVHNRGVVFDTNFGGDFISTEP